MAHPAWQKFSLLICININFQEIYSFIMLQCGARVFFSFLPNPMGVERFFFVAVSPSHFSAHFPSAKAGGRAASGGNFGTTVLCRFRRDALLVHAFGEGRPHFQAKLSFNLNLCVCVFFF